MLLCSQTKPRSPCGSSGAVRSRKVAPGVDFAELEDVVPAELPEGPWVVYAGNPDVYQDLPVLMDAMRQLDGVGLLMVSASCLDDWAKVGLPKFMAVQTSDFSEVKRLVSAADVAAIPRTVCSGFPIKLLNTLGLGVPTVVAEGSARGLPGRWWFPTETPEQWRAPYVTFSRPEYRRGLSARARSHVRRACTWDARAAELEAIYARVVAH